MQVNYVPRQSPVRRAFNLSSSQLCSALRHCGWWINPLGFTCSATSTLRLVSINLLTDFSDVKAAFNESQASVDHMSSRTIKHFFLFWICSIYSTSSSVSISSIEFLFSGARHIRILCNTRSVCHFCEIDTHAKPAK